MMGSTMHPLSLLDAPGFWGDQRACTEARPCSNRDDPHYCEAIAVLHDRGVASEIAQAQGNQCWLSVRAEVAACEWLNALKDVGLEPDLDPVRWVRDRNITLTPSGTGDACKTASPPPPGGKPPPAVDCSHLQTGNKQVDQVVCWIAKNPLMAAGGAFLLLLLLTTGRMGYR